MSKFAPIAKTNVCPKAEFAASDLKPGGSVLEAEQTDATPKSLEQLLEGFTADDATSLRERMMTWRADKAAGNEVI